MARIRSKSVFITGLWRENPVFRQILGICSALAVTNLLINTLIMGLSLIFVVTMSNMTVSILRNITPTRIRMMVQTLIIASYVIIVDITLKAYLPDISVALGPYVGLIITNCIIMGRCEAFARNNSLWPSFLDGIGSGCGYAVILLTVAFFRELMGFGSLFGVQVMSVGWTNWVIMVMAPGAFFMLGVVIWVVRSFGAREEEAEIKR
ncbi:MAG: NADH:ubiquinone reductase (Na(+)-transporting) subunit D [Syntrophobacterales bacterium]|nr:MAG: NADH:ubiquinone reductase (Na(+)-transporting) subunit D [Syntrophobacterales bacterium]